MSDPICTICGQPVEHDCSGVNPNIHLTCEIKQRKNLVKALIERELNIKKLYNFVLIGQMEKTIFGILKNI